MQKIAMFSNVPLKRMFSMHDRPSIYTIPDAMRRSGLDREVLSILGLHDRADSVHEDDARVTWNAFTSALLKPRKHHLKIGLAGKYAALRDAYASIDKAIEHCAIHLDASADLEWIESEEITDANAAKRLGDLDAVIVPGGFGARGVEGKVACVKHCREQGIPYLGICLGFQVAVIEFARHVLGLKDANSTEFDPNCPHAVISELPEQKRIEQLGGTMRLGGQDVLLTPGSIAAHLYDATTVRERFRHRYEVEPKYIDQLEAAGLIFSGRHPQQPIMQFLELPTTARTPGGVAHPYFVGAQFHPELTGRPLRPQPMFMGLIAAAIRRKDPEASVGRWACTNDNIGSGGPDIRVVRGDRSPLHA
jgi:CTP synthase